MSTSAAEMTTPQVSGENNVRSVKNHPSFELLRVEKIESLGIEVEEYRHLKTGAMHYHIDADNEENVFLVAFRTVPMDSTGVAHILEHTSLCGSKKYPVRDPFFMMIRRSLNTFMNAFTSSDWTAYPFASQNRKDFNNLMDVYLDAVFFTRLDELDFLQEGHRVEFQKQDDTESALEYKGVVFNEMKGAMSSPVSVLWQTISKYLYPTTTYHFNSGGEPEDIPDLSYQQLLDFHETHYHPSNSVFMTFGNIPAYEHQEKFEDQALSHFERLDKNIHVAPEKRYLSPIEITESYAYDSVGDDVLSEKTHQVMGWLLGESASLEEVLKANLLANVLLDNSASPLRMALEKTDLGTAPSPLCGLEDSNFEMCFICGIEGSETKHAEAFEKLVLDVLNDVEMNGVPVEKLEAVLHQLELSQREITGDGYPFGLHLILEGLSAAIHRRDPVELLNVEPVIDKLRESIKDPAFIKTLVREMLLENQHRVRLTLRPDSELSQRKQAAEKARLESIKNSLTEKEKRSIVQQTQDLLKRQQQVDDPAVLPKVDLEDVPTEIHFPDYEETSISAKPATTYAQGTNGLVYQEIAYELPELDEGTLQLLPYYSSCLTELGHTDKDYLEVQSWQSAVSGGVSAHSRIRADIDDVQASKGHYLVSGKALERNNKKLAELISSTLRDVRFDEYDRIREIISQRRASKERSVTGSGHTLAMMAASSGMGPVARLNHQFSGLEGIRLIKKIDDANIDKKSGTEAVKNLAGQLAEIHRKVISMPSQYLLIAEENKMVTITEEFGSVWKGLSDANGESSFSLATHSERVQQMWVTNTQVNFCAKAYPTVTMTHDDAPALSVLAGFMRNGYLHTAVREQGGAYGGGAGHDSSIAAFRFFSYRDPRLIETLNDFDRAIDWVMNHNHEWRQVEEAILGVIGSIDKPSSPAGEASHDFHNRLHGRTREMLKEFRARVLEVRLEDLRRVAETYLKPEKASTAVITSSSTLKNLDDMGFEIINL